MLKRRLALQLLLVVPGTLHNIIDTQFRNSLQYTALDTNIISQILEAQ